MKDEEWIKDIMYSRLRQSPLKYEKNCLNSNRNSVIKLIDQSLFRRPKMKIIPSIAATGKAIDGNSGI
jgi:hypothetical protein